MGNIPAYIKMSTFIPTNTLIIGNGQIIHIYTIGTSSKMWLDIEELYQYQLISNEIYYTLKGDSIKLYATLEIESKHVSLVNQDKIPIQILFKILQKKDECIY